MAYYVIRVAPRKEEQFLKLTAKMIQDEGVTAVFPRRRLEHLKRGRRVSTEVALFPGYVFLRSDAGLDSALYAKIKALPLFGVFVKQGDLVPEVRGKDLELLRHFLKFGEVAPASLVSFDENQRIRVHSGPMEGMEGRIIHVDRRKRRAKIQLDFIHGSFTLTLGFELLTEQRTSEAAV